MQGFVSHKNITYKLKKRKFCDSGPFSINKTDKKNVGHIEMDEDALREMSLS